MGGWYGHCPYLVKGKHSEPELITTLEYKHDHVTLADAEAHEICRRTIALLLDVAEGKTYTFAFVVSPQQSQLIRFFLCPKVHHVVGEVEMVGYDKLEVIYIVLL